MTSVRTCVVCGQPIEAKRYFDKNGKFKGYGKSLTKQTCSRSCANVYRAGLDLVERFWSKVDRSGGEDACWPFRGSDVKGYGRVSWNGKLELAHRVAWSIANGRPLPKEDVLHTCDNPPCCNPRHLFLGSQHDNMADMVRKGRAARQSGEANGRATLTEADVRAIRARYEPRKVTQAMLAEEYGVRQPTISAILRGELWPHVR